MNKFVLSLILATASLQLQAEPADRLMLDCFSFIDTRSEKDLRCILEFMAKQSDDVIFYAYDWNNREFISSMASQMANDDSSHMMLKNSTHESLTKYQAKMNEIKRTDLKKFNTIVACKEAMAMLKMLQSEDPRITAMGKKLVAENPKLDYWAKIQALAGQNYKEFACF